MSENAVGISERWNAWVEALAQRWSALAPRDRRMLGIGIAVLAVTLTYFVFFEPAFLGRKKAQEELPALRAQLGQVESLGAEAKRLLTAPVGLDNPAALKGLIEQSVVSASLKGQLLGVTQTGDLIEAKFKAVPFSQWLLWLESTSRETRMRVVDVALVKEGADGLASGKVVFEIAKRVDSGGANSSGRTAK
jgi:general secretion pathway protein M